MIIHLVRLPPDTLGIYGRKKTILPRRMLLMGVGPALDSFWHLYPRIRFSDIYRSGESSLRARKTKRGVQAPAYSGHNFGLSVDVDVVRTLKMNRWTYGELLDFMVHNGWYCYRRDGKRGKEDWHFNYFGVDSRKFLKNINPKKRKTWKNGAEQAIQSIYRDDFDLDLKEAQAALAALRMYHGDIDGDPGPLTREAVGVFARAWGVAASVKSARFQRTLAFVSATIHVDDNLDLVA